MAQATQTAKYPSYAWRTFVLLLACAWLTLSAVAAGTDADALSADELLALRNSYIATAAGPDEVCVQSLALTRPLAFRDWTETSLAWWMRYLGCRDTVAGAHWSGRETAVAEALAHFDAAPARPGTDRTARIALLDWYWITLRRDGDPERAEALEQAEVRRLLAARSSPGAVGERAADELQVWAGRQYGRRGQTLRTQAWIDRIRQWSGEADPVLPQLLIAKTVNERRLGRPAQAIQAIDEAQALVLRYHAQDRRQRMRVLGERMATLPGANRFAEARDAALALRDDLLQTSPLPHSNLMRTFYNLAALSIEIGDFDAAVGYADASISHARSSPHPNDEFEALAAAVWREEARLLRGDADAPAALQAALTAATHSEMATGGPAFTLAKHAAQQHDEARLQWARQFMQRFQGVHLDRLHTDRALLPVLDSWVGLGDRAALERSVAHTFSGRSTQAAVQTQFALARLLAPQAPDDAIWLYKRAADTLQQMRQGLPSSDDSVQRAWLADHEPDLRQYIGLLIDGGRLVEAQQAIQVLRNEELQEYTRRSGDGRQRGAAQALVFTVGELQRNALLRPVALRFQAALPAVAARADAEPDWDSRINSRDADGEQALDDATNGLRQALGLSLQQSTRVPTHLARPLPAGRVRLQYFLRADGVDIVVQGPAGIRRVRQALTPVQLNRATYDLRAALSQPGQDPMPAARQLYKWLLAPVAQDIRGAGTLHIAADGVLRMLPFAALHDGRVWVAQRHAVIAEFGPPPAAATRQNPRTPPRLLALGRTLADAEHAALPGVGQELALLRQLPGLLVQSGADSAFTEASLREGLAQGPQVVHLASHFVLDAATEQSAYLLLGDGQRLPLARLRAMPWRGVHLAVLSACDTGLPDVGATGLQLTGLAGALQDAGAANVLATLWPVNDRSTASWMAGFYGQGGRRTGLPQAQWVAQAQRRWLLRHTGTPLAHPHHWAGFVWMSGA